MAELDPHAVQRVIKHLTKSCDENPGRAIGIAAVLAALPEAANVDAQRVKAIIERMLKNFVGASSDTRAAANSVSAMIIAAASISRRKPGAMAGDDEKD